MPETISLSQSGSVATLTLNRPETRNAMSYQMIREISAYFASIREDRSIRAVIIGAAGSTFCSGGDIKDLQAQAEQTLAERASVMSEVDTMLRAINEAPQVTIARVQGAAMGGGFGLVCVSDIALASSEAQFGLPEVRLGVAPALISPYVIQRLGLTRARQLMLTGARFDAETAFIYGLIHQVCSPAKLDAAIAETLNSVLACSPNALAETKKLIFHVINHSLDESLPYRANLISSIRETEEAQAGMLAFIQKQAPPWAETFNPSED